MRGVVRTGADVDVVAVFVEVLQTYNQTASRNGPVRVASVYVHLHRKYILTRLSPQGSDPIMLVKGSI